jgi:hypothetical protein
LQSVLTVYKFIGQIYLIDICPRTALDIPMFEQLIADHKARHHDWLTLFNDEDGDLLDDEGDDAKIMSMSELI